MGELITAVIVDRNLSKPRDPPSIPDSFPINVRHAQNSMACFWLLGKML